MATRLITRQIFPRQPVSRAAPCCRRRPLLYRLSRGGVGLCRVHPETVIRATVTLAGTCLDES